MQECRTHTDTQLALLRTEMAERVHHENNEFERLERALSRTRLDMEMTLSVQEQTMADRVPQERE